MGYLGMSEKSQTLRYALLTTKVTEVLLDVGTKKIFADREKETLERGVQLLDEIIDGANFVDGKDLESMSPTEESLTTYRYALSTLQALQLISKVEKITEKFQQLKSDMQLILSGEQKAGVVEHLMDFFFSLGSAFRE
ncbi:MAG: hypothetical protein C0399_05000, partial [Syntrophus sp. (in: bacteria)]|nr:hypothetical protein [Syntrophus sp. (in: bacteria)]